MTHENTAIARGSGKWGDPEVPRTGWTCQDILDHGDDSSMVCEMCEYMHIRYEHVMTHPTYPETLGCGCICSGHMDENMAGAVDRQRKAEQRTKNAKAKIAREAKHEAERLAELADDAEATRRHHERRKQEKVEMMENLTWKMSQSGNWWAKAPDGWRIIVYEHKDGGWKYMFCLGDDAPQWGKPRYDDPEDAQQDAVDVFTAALKKA